MKISWNWLRELVELPAGLGPKEVATRLGLCGVAVDGVQAVGQGLSGLVVAEVRGKRPHPKADKLTIVTVFDGQSETEVVCGAPNVPLPGDGGPGRRPRVVWARPGATLPSGMTLSVREVRGVSSPGMLCAEDELGLSEDHGGILILSPDDGLAIGADFASGADLPDHVFELDITANRPDLLGHLGVARELVALLGPEGAQLRPLPTDLATTLGGSHLGPEPAAALAQVEILDLQGCPRYLAHVLTGVTVGPSPLRQRLRLQRLGVRPRSNVVDATNLALLLWGHPLHAFDLQALRGRRVVVRRARHNETLRTLDGVDRALGPDDLVIADGEQATALAGVMGGQDSEVRATTTDILLESAYFDPASVRRTARRFRLHTEASHRFERGADPNAGVLHAAKWCAAQIVGLAGGRLAPGSLDVYPAPRRGPELELRPERTDAIWGMQVPPDAQAAALRRLGLAVQEAPGGRLQVTVPTFRPDLTREIDLIEEVGRLHGLDKLPPTLPRLQVAPPADSTPALRARRNAETARDICTALGLDEVILFSMLGPERLRLVGGAQAAAPLRLDNPLREELSALRTQLLPGLLDSMQHNLSHGLSEVRLFEVGEVFLPRPGELLPAEPTRVAGVVAGHREHFLKPGPADRLDIHDVRGMVEQLLVGLGYELLWAAPPAGSGAAHQVFVRAAAAEQTPWLHPGVAAVVVSAHSGEPLGSYGEVHPDLRQKLGIEVPVLAFELAVPDFARPARRYAAPSRFPAVTRDLSFFIDAGIPAGEVIAALHGAGEALLSEVHIREDYREAGHVPAGLKGLLFNLTYRLDERTLVDEEVNKAHERVVGHLKSRFTVQLR
jgi:phenylalanyl-tRNA synthetase beta chain